MRSAQNNRQRPVAMILHDPFAMHRKWWDQNWTPETGDDFWTEWDYVLAEAFQVIEDFTDASNGQWLPDDMSGDVTWIAKKKYSGYDAEIARARERNTLRDGESLYAVPEFDPDKPKPTLQSMMDALEEERADGRPAHLKDARPPTPEELAALRGTGKLDL